MLSFCEVQYEWEKLPRWSENWERQAGVQGAGSGTALAAGFATFQLCDLEQIIPYVKVLL